MHTSMIRTTFVAFAALTMAIGCSDANAGEAVTYLPADQPCAGSDGGDATDVPGLPSDDDQLHDDTDDRDGNTDLDDQPRPGLLYMTGTATDASPAVDDEPMFDVADEDPGSLQLASNDETDVPVDGADTIDINNADVDELTRLPGIGPALAERIVEYRHQRTFDDPDQLQRIDGIGPATLEELLPKVRAD